MITSPGVKRTGVVVPEIELLFTYSTKIVAGSPSAAALISTMRTLIVDVCPVKISPIKAENVVGKAYVVVSSLPNSNLVSN